ncbi:protein FAM217B isoform X1 [Mustela lutreola]|uniref:protein FAM217B isoform X1 n=2 Tax=Mustela lutreola TaxID=9666 RepID=UPI0027972A44|nr:protein FAM217B isoform X1 [Mustela lutreola]
MVSGGESSFPNIRGIKKSLPQLSSSANILSKNISSTTEKTVCQTLEDDQPSDFFKKGNRVTKSHQKSSNMNGGPSWNKVQRSKNPSGKRQSQSQVPRVPSQPPADGLQDSRFPEGKPKRSPPGAQRRGASGKELFLDLQCTKIPKEGVGEDEGSASDLSDSERVPLLPSVRAPPELHLRAEEIHATDPGPESDAEAEARGGAHPSYQYADFLPAPFSSWDLRDLAVPPGTEPRPAARCGAVGPLARYIDRLVQLEWLQMQTVQGEKGKSAKAKPPTVPGMSTGALKSPGRSKLVASAAARPPQEGACKPGALGASRRKELHPEEARPSYYAFDTAKGLRAPRASRPSSQKPALDVRMEEQRKKVNKSPRLQRWDPPCGDSGGARAPAQGATPRNSATPGGAARTQAHAGLKKKGGASSCVPTAIASEKKPKTNGVKPSTYKFKQEPK